jgi:hypothetical protein
MSEKSIPRVLLLIVQGFIALTALAGGTAMVLGALVPSLATVLSPPVDYLVGSPFASYLVPGLLLGLVLGGLHVVAFLMLLRRTRWSLVASAVVAFDTMIWIFVQMIVIPFSFLQAIYFAAGLAEFGLLLLILGLFSTLPKR